MAGLGTLRESEAGQKHIRAESECRDGMLAKTYVGQDLNELAHIMNAKFDELSEHRRRLFLDNARTVRPVLVNNWVDIPFTCEQARGLRMPVLLIDGENTDADMRDINLESMKCLPEARRVVLPNSTHAIQFDAPEAMAHPPTVEGASAVRHGSWFRCPGARSFFFTSPTTAASAGAAVAVMTGAPEHAKAAAKA